MVGGIRWLSNKSISRGTFCSRNVFFQARAVQPSSHPEIARHLTCSANPLCVPPFLDVCLR